MAAKVSLDMETSLDGLRSVIEAMEELARAEGWPPAIEYRIRLALEEVGINVVNHGRPEGRLHTAAVEIASDAEKIVLDIVDDGRPFDPLIETPAPDLDSSVEDRPVGGLGVYLVMRMMDEVRYRRDGDRNRLTLIKRRAE